MDFETWMDEVDWHVDEMLGQSVYDLPDCTFYDWYEDGMSPKEAASRCINEAF